MPLALLHNVKEPSLYGAWVSSPCEPIPVMQAKLNDNSYRGPTRSCLFVFLSFFLSFLSFSLSFCRFPCFFAFFLVYFAFFLLVYLVFFVLFLVFFAFF